ncbi:hypothetical protein BJV82DRAFT_588462 [Fennellomyces sp. T-0311]|nr:hypothetical protein BJV82DRAFT_588462 [Fennellomyces sp. T-0311]
MSRQCMSIDAIILNPTKQPPQPPPQLLSPPNSTVGAPNSPPPSPVMSEASTHDSYKCHSSVSLDERRHRNKIASAKYRAKKQASMRAMAAKLAQISAENASLQRELAKAHEDNEALRSLCKSFMPSPPSTSSSPSLA